MLWTFGIGAFDLVKMNVSYMVLGYMLWMLEALFERVIAKSLGVCRWSRSSGACFAN